MDSLINLNAIFDHAELSVGVISDTHSRLNKDVVGSLQNCDVILHAGDIGNVTVLEDLNQFTPHVYSVRGNNDIEDKWPGDDISALNKIPHAIELTFNEQRIAMTHGHQFPAVETRHQKLREQFPQANIIIYGHSHLLVCDQEHEQWVINPGAGGYNRTFRGASCLVMHYKNRQWQIEETRIQKSA